MSECPGSRMTDPHVSTPAVAWCGAEPPKRNVDPLDQNTAFADQQHADFPLPSDPTKKTADAYGVLRATVMANRWTFYIGKDGVIQSIDKNVKPARSAEDMAAKLQERGISTRGQ